MRNLLAILIVGIAVAGCPAFLQDTGDPVVDARVNTIMTVRDACSTYVSAINVFTAAVNADEVTLNQIQVSEDIRKAVDPLCSTSEPPANKQAVITQISIGASRLLLISQTGGSP